MALPFAPASKTPAGAVLQGASLTGSRHARRNTENAAHHRMGGVLVGMADPAGQAGPAMCTAGRSSAASSYRPQGSTSMLQRRWRPNGLASAGAHSVSAASMARNGDRRSAWTSSSARSRPSSRVRVAGMGSNTVTPSISGKVVEICCKNAMASLRCGASARSTNWWQNGGKPVSCRSCNRLAANPG